MKLITLLPLIATVAANRGYYGDECSANRYRRFLGAKYMKNSNTFRMGDILEDYDLSKDQPVIWIQGCFNHRRDLPPRRKGTLYVRLSNDNIVKGFSCNGYRDRGVLCKDWKPSNGEVDDYNDNVDDIEFCDGPINVYK